MRMLVKWVLSVFSEETGTGSESRLAAYTVTVGALALVWVATLRHLEIPPGAQTILLTLLGLTTTAYGVNKFKTKTNDNPSQSFTGESVTRTNIVPEKEA